MEGVHSCSHVPNVYTPVPTRRSYENTGGRASLDFQTLGSKNPEREVPFHLGRFVIATTLSERALRRGRRWWGGGNFQHEGPRDAL